jgi:hypothetical protein
LTDTDLPDSKSFIKSSTSPFLVVVLKEARRNMERWCNPSKRYFKKRASKATSREMGQTA